MLQHLLSNCAVDVLHARVPVHHCARIVAACPARGAVGHDNQTNSAAHSVQRAGQGAFAFGNAANRVSVMKKWRELTPRCPVASTGCRAFEDANLCGHAPNDAVKWAKAAGHPGAHIYQPEQCEVDISEIQFAV